MKKYLILIFWLGYIGSTLAQQVIDRPQLFKRPSPYERYTTYRASLTAGLGAPTGTFQNYMGKNTFRNYAASVDFVFPNNNFSVGATFGSQYFQNRLSRQVYEFSDGAVSAVQTRAFSAYSLVATGSYHFAKVNAPVRPYVQVGLGAAFAELTNYYGTIPTGENGFKLVAQAGAGVRALLSKKGNFGVELGANYQHLPFKVESEGITDAASLNVRFGVFYRWW